MVCLWCAVFFNHSPVEGILNLFWYLNSVKACYEYSRADIFMNVLIHLEQMPQIAIVQYSNCMFTFIRSSQSLFQSDCAILYSHQECLNNPCFWIPASIWCCNIILNFSSFARYVWYSGLVLICIFWTLSNI